MDFRPNSAQPLLLPALCGSLLVVAGCGQPSAPAPQPAERPAEGISLRVSVLGDAPLAESIARLAGEWQDIAGGDLSAEPATAATPEALPEIDADIVVFPSRYLGTLSERELIRPVRRSVLNDESLSWSDVHPLTRNYETVTQSQVMALPLGTLSPLLCFRADWFRDQQRQVPSSWEEYQSAVDTIRRDSSLRVAPAEDGPAASPQVAAIEPMEGNWAAFTLLARAAAYVQHRSEEGRLFQPDTMRARIDRPPFVRALEEMRRALASDESMPELAGGEIMDALREGRAVLGICWPAPSTTAADGALPIGFASLPGATEVYNPGTAAWQPAPRGLLRATLVGSSGRLMSVTKSSRNAATAFRLLAWLATPEISRLAARVSPGAGPCRGTQSGGNWWRGRGWARGEARQAVAGMMSAAQADAWLLIPRIGHIDRYLESLASAVRRVVQQNGDAAAELRTVAEEWEAITDEIGRSQQIRAYRRQLVGADHS